MQNVQRLLLVSTLLSSVVWLQAAHAAVMNETPASGEAIIVGRSAILLAQVSRLWRCRKARTPRQFGAICEEPGNSATSVANDPQRTLAITDYFSDHEVEVRSR